MRPHRLRRAFEVLRTEGPLAVVRKTARHGARAVKGPLMRSRRISRAVEVIASDGYRAVADKVLHHGYELLKITVLRSRFAERRNYHLSIDELHAKTIRVRSNPRDITIESTTFCNLKCVMCEHGMEGMVANKRHFPEHLVRRLLPFLPTATRFQLHSLGEPLMSPAFWMLLDEITAVHRGAPEITFNSNGHLLNETNITRLMGTKVREINISFDAATPDTYAKIRGGDFSRLLANVRSLVEARKRYGRSDFKISINMTLMRANIEELPEFVRLAKQLGVDEVGFWRLNDGENYERPDWIITKGDWTFSYGDESPKHYPNLFNAKVREAARVAKELHMPLLQDKNWFIEGEGQREDRSYAPTASASSDRYASAAATAVLEAPPSVAAAPPQQLVQLHTNVASEVLRVDAASGVPAPKNAAIRNCEAPWKWLVVNNRGDCLPCCYLQGTLGNLEKQSISEIWNGSTIQEIRSSIANGEVHRLCQGASCQYVRGDAAADSSVDSAVHAAH